MDGREHLSGWEGALEWMGGRLEWMGENIP